MVLVRKKNLITGMLVGVCLLAMGVAATVQAQSFSARGVDMRGAGLQEKQENPCKSAAKIHLPELQNSDSNGCVSIIGKTPSGHFVVGVTSSFEENTTFEGDTVFDGPVQIGDAASCTPAKAGTLRYNSGTNMLEYCDGSSFQDLEGERGPQGPQGPPGPPATCPE